MKKIEAIIKRENFSFVRRTLADAGFTALTVYDVRGRGKQGATIIVPGSEARIYVDLLPKLKIEIYATDADVEKIVDIIIEKTHTGKIGDGKIFISDVADVVRIRDGARGKETI